MVTADNAARMIIKKTDTTDIPIMDSLFIFMFSSPNIYYDMIFTYLSLVCIVEMDQLKL